MPDLFGNDGPTRNFDTFKKWVWGSWESHHGAKPPWGRAEAKSIHTIYKRLPSDGLARQVWQTYLANHEAFFAGHDPKKLLNQLSRFTADAAQIAESPRRDKPTDRDRELVAKNLAARGLEIRKGFIVHKETPKSHQTG